jgi:hypothetical protein
MPRVDLDPNTLDGKHAQFQLKSYYSIFNDIESLGLKVIGVDFYESTFELDGIVPPEWRTYHKKNKILWPSWDAIQIWGNIGHGAFEKEDGFLWDLASRISYQLNTCTLRLREVSLSYNNQLDAQLKGNDFIPDKNDGFTSFIYLAIQAVLIDACILRDYIAEFVSSYLILPNYPHLNTVTTMANLKKQLSKVNIYENIFLKQLYEQTEESGWLNILGNYRDLIIHSAPLAQARKKFFIKTSFIEISQEKKQPIIICPIPINPSQIRNLRASGTYFKDFKNQFETFAGLISDEKTSIDGLQYIHQIFGELSQHLIQLATYSPIEPKMMEFNNSNIIGPTEIKNI